MRARLPRKLFARLCLLLSLTLAAQGVFAASAMCGLAGTPTPGSQAHATHSAPCAPAHDCRTSGCDCTQSHAQFIAAMPPDAVSPPVIRVTFDPPPAPLIAGVLSLPLRPPISRSA
jgi:hypothetical protein